MKRKTQITLTDGALVRLLRMKEKEAPEVSLSTYIKRVLDVAVKNKEVYYREEKQALMRYPRVNDGESTQRNNSSNAPGLGAVR